MCFTIFCQVTMFCPLLTKMDRNRLLKDNTSLEAVTLIEESDNENSNCLTMNTYNAMYVLLNFCVKCDCVTGRCLLVNQ